MAKDACPGERAETIKAITLGRWAMRRPCKVKGRKQGLGLVENSAGSGYLNGMDRVDFMDRVVYMDGFAEKRVV